VLRECITRAGSIEGGLRKYVGATSDATEGGYALKVMAEHARLRAVAGGKAVPTFVPPAPQIIPVVAPITRRAPAPVPEAAKADTEDKIASFVNS
jgi:hypothetical protein